MSSYKTVISSKGQVIIPAGLRDEFGLEKGTRATWTKEKGRLILTPITTRRLREIRGCLKPPPGTPTMFDDLFVERERERKREKL
jgi:AbrB family looped-hinge helix DNA binding protein